MGQFVSWTKEFVSPARCVSEDQLVRDMRGKLLDIARDHAVLANDPSGLSAMVPEHTILPRSCAAPNSCPGLVINASIGLTRQVAELSLNQAIQHFLELGADVVTAMATKLPGANLTMANPDAYRKYLLLNALSDDVLARLVSLNAALSNFLNTRVQQNMTITVTTFVTFMVVLLAGAVMLMHVALRVLRQESRALTTLPFMLPQTAAAMVPELMAFVESGGLQLRSSDSSETVATTTK
ncbi:hypothetical protein BCR44DRAFT_63316 [Catenaria anguillulae PL171]|uniref:Uncharacterized protein n=1 Tax=Catenaria anguillulae PL171 TaxID=765915 RepID=A0A1Y2HRW9_9FUNG|nr:hypothetical protein BCR44DRAFT_63316 [Catenaria anguillulae PL171]